MTVSQVDLRGVESHDSTCTAHIAAIFSVSKHHTYTAVIDFPENNCFHLSNNVSSDFIMWPVWSLACMGLCNPNRWKENYLSWAIDHRNRYNSYSCIYGHDKTILPAHNYTHYLLMSRRLIAVGARRLLDSGRRPCSFCTQTYPRYYPSISPGA